MNRTQVSTKNSLQWGLNRIEVSNVVDTEGEARLDVPSSELCGRWRDTPPDSVCFLPF